MLAWVKDLVLQHNSLQYGGKNSEEAEGRDGISLENNACVVCKGKVIKLSNDRIRMSHFVP